MRFFILMPLLVFASVLLADGAIHTRNGSLNNLSTTQVYTLSPDGVMTGGDSATGIPALFVISAPPGSHVQVTFALPPLLHTGTPGPGVIYCSYGPQSILDGNTRMYYDQSDIPIDIVIPPTGLDTLFVGITAAVSNNATLGEYQGEVLCGATLPDFSVDTASLIYQADVLRQWVATGIVQEKGIRSPKFTLSPNYPNPFNPSTRIEYSLAERSNILLTISNDLGQVVAVPVDGIREAGMYSVIWNASNFVSGVYFYRLEAVSVSDPSKHFAGLKKMELLK